MPRIMHASRARKLGLPQDTAIEEIIEGCVWTRGLLFYHHYRHG